MPSDVTLNFWSLEQEHDVTTELSSVLSADECARAARFATGALRRRFAVARGGMRYLLAAITGHPPAALVFEYGPYGKPRLTIPVAFNLSHTADLACLAVTCANRDMTAEIPSIGVDIERLGPVENGLAERVLSDGELAFFKGLPPDERTDAFYRAWTRKEAVMKACGRGLSLAPRRFSVDLAGAAVSAVLALPDDLPDPGCWRLSGFDADDGTTGAVAVIGETGGALKISRQWWRPQIDL